MCAVWYLNNLLYLNRNTNKPFLLHALPFSSLPGSFLPSSSFSPPPEGEVCVFKLLSVLVLQGACSKLEQTRQICSGKAKLAHLPATSHRVITISLV